MNISYGEAGLGLLNFTTGLDLALIGFGGAETGVGVVVGVGGVLQGAQGLGEIWNGLFGGDIHSPIKPPAAIGCTLGADPNNALDALQEARDLNALLNELESYLQQLSRDLAPTQQPQSPPGAIVGQQA